MADVTLSNTLEAHRFQWRTAGTWCDCGWGDVAMHHHDYDQHLANQVEAIVAARVAAALGEVEARISETPWGRIDGTWVAPYAEASWITGAKAGVNFAARTVREVRGEVGG